MDKDKLSLPNDFLALSVDPCEGLLGTAGAGVTKLFSFPAPLFLDFDPAVKAGVSVLEPKLKFILEVEVTVGTKPFGLAGMKIRLSTFIIINNNKF